MDKQSFVSGFALVLRVGLFAVLIALLFGVWLRGSPALAITEDDRAVSSVMFAGPGDPGDSAEPPPLPPPTSGGRVPTPIKPRGVRWVNFQAADFVLGQSNFTSNGSGTTASTFNVPQKVAVDPTTNKVFVSDYNNHRVLRFAAWSALTNGAAAEAVLGQSDFTSNTPGCAANKFEQPRGIFVDSGGRLWVADEFGDRVLRFDNASTKANGANADGVLGQSDFTNCLGAVAQNKVNDPADVYVDAVGRLWVADEENNRVLRFDNAAAKANGANADGVLGQSGFTTNTAATTQNGMNFPQALVLDGAGNLFVAEYNNRRVLRFNNAAAKANGANADGVLGQSNFTGNANNVTATGLGRSYGVTMDSDGRLYASDYENNRVLIYENAAALANGSAASYVLGQPGFTSGTANNGGVSASSLYAPRRLFFDNTGRRLWVADGANNRVLRYLALATTTTLTSSLNPSIFGQSVTFTATVNESEAAAPTGTVSFKDGATTLGTGTVNGSGRATFTTSLLTVGTHPITAEYSGDANFTSSTSAVLTQMVNQPAPAEVPEADALLLLSGGIGGLGVWLRWQWARRRGMR